MQSKVYCEGFKILKDNRFIPFASCFAVTASKKLVWLEMLYLVFCLFVFASVKSYTFRVLIGKK